MRFFIGLVLVVGLWTTPKSAGAAEWLIRDVRQHVRHDQLDVTGTLDPRWVGASFWYTVPLMEDGFVPPINDSLHLELGGHFMTLFYHPRSSDALFGIMPLIGPRWSFHLTTNWTAFATMKAGYEFLFVGRAWPSLDGSIGAYWQPSEEMWVRLEVGARGMLRVGVSVPM
jgi:hypothetical protein